jgi:pimeloyl-ACP methyl ester carboxylesterase
VSVPTRRVRHLRINLALHQLQDGANHPLLLLHGLGERTPAHVPGYASAWPGPVWGLDFTGHGDSDVPSGGGYTAEVLMGDADAALAEIGPSTVLGRGLGAYVALLIAGARPHMVRGVVLCDGPGIAGGGTGPSSTMLVGVADEHALAPPDPFALAELSRDVRPADYAATFARQASTLSELSTPLTVCARWRPPWLEAVASEPGVAEGSIEDALASYAAS